MYQFYKVKNWSHERWNPFSPAVEKLPLEYHNGFSNGLTHVTCHSNKLKEFNFKTWLLTVQTPKASEGITTDT